MAKRSPRLRPKRRLADRFMFVRQIDDRHVIGFLRNSDTSRNQGFQFFVVAGIRGPIGERLVDGALQSDMHGQASGSKTLSDLGDRAFKALSNRKGVHSLRSAGLPQNLETELQASRQARKDTPTEVHS